MTNFTLLATALLVIGGTSFARADPSDDVSDELTSPPAPTHYLQLAAFAGGVDHTDARHDQFDVFAGGAVDGGYALGYHHLWLHGRLATGAAGRDIGGYGGEMIQARLGIEARGCVVSVVCAFAGADVGVTRYQMADYTNPIMRVDHTDVGVFARAGLDIGSRSFRVRPELDLGLDQHARSSVALTLGFAYLW